MTNKSKIEASLRHHGLRGYVNAIDSNGRATRGEVVLWINGMGHPVYSIKQALKVVRQAKESSL